MTFNHQHMTHFRVHLAQSLIDDSTPQSHVSSLPKRTPKKAKTRTPSRTTTTTKHQHPGKQTQYQLPRLIKLKEERMEGERGGDQSIKNTLISIEPAFRATFPQALVVLGR